MNLLPRRHDYGEVAKRLYPEMGAGGFSHVDGHVLFFLRVQALVTDSSVVLDLGAGRGAWAEIVDGAKRDIMTLKGQAGHLIGADIDPIVKENPLVDEAVVMPDGASIPLPDASVDVIVARSVFEHVDDPSAFSDEITRVLRPGGWICAFTPNRFGVTALSATAVPNKLHAAVLRRMEPLRKTGDVFPTRYRLNTIQALNEHFPSTLYANRSYYFDGQPGYHGGYVPLAKALRLWGKIMPGRLANTLHVFIQRHPEQC